jgi:hypothetical protein
MIAKVARIPPPDGQHVVTQLVTHNEREGSTRLGAALSDLLLRPSGRQDLNLRPLDPQIMWLDVSARQTR